jgi:tetratricopeptide (TPR) repeat protein
MSRLHLVFLFVLFTFQTFSQAKLKQIVSFADEQYKKGDYYYALEYYKQALAQDSNSVELLWKFAETQKAYKDYVQAEKYYALVYAKDVDEKYAKSILNLGLMQKQNGNYSRAFETMKLAKKRFANGDDDYSYKKAIQEIESCAWALKNISDTIQPMKKLPLTVNSYDAEFGHSVRDNKLIFSSLRADSTKDATQEVYSKNYKTKLYSSEIKDGEFEKNNQIQDLIIQKLNTGNGSFSLDGNKFYFSACEDEGFNYRCKIMVANYTNGKWSKIDSLKQEINPLGTNNTMPLISKLNGKEVLFFASDREGTKGGLDIWYAFPEGENRFKEITNVNVINSPDNELSPWMDTVENRLYFSSSWHNGFGGQDVFYSKIDGNKFAAPTNTGLPINSPANDQYYFKHKDTVYVSSNRIGSYYSKNPTCCSDIFAIYPPKKTQEIVEVKTETKIETKTETKIETEFQKRIKEKLPVTLYFRNDEPDASTLAATTKQNYINTYKLYQDRYDLYKKEVAKGLTDVEALKKQQALDNFFEKNVDKGANDLISFTDMILQELKSGSVVTLTIKGFASPLAKTAYNVNLTKRRISSLINYFNETKNGEFKQYTQGKSKNGGKLIFVMIPFGEYTANQTTSDDVKNQSSSVYSKEAGIERKIQIENVSFDKGEVPFPIESLNPIFTAGEVKKGDKITGSFKINNISSESIELELDKQDPTIQVSFNSIKVAPKSSAIVTFVVDTQTMSGLSKNMFKVKVKGFQNSIEFFVTSEVK